jgi:hypothetical protein
MPTWQGKNKYWAEKPTAAQHQPFTNNETMEWVLEEQLVTWGFKLTKEGKVPALVSDKAEEFLENKAKEIASEAKH